MSEKPRAGELDFLLQRDLREYVERSLGTERDLPTLILHDRADDKRAIFAALGPRKGIKSRLRSYEWDAEIGHGGPSLVTYYDRQPSRTLFEPRSPSQGFVPLVHHRDFHGLLA